MIFTEEDRMRELRLAQKDIYNAGNNLVSAGLRLQGTKYEKSYEHVRLLGLLCFHIRHSTCQV